MEWVLLKDSDKLTEGADYKAVVKSKIPFVSRLYIFFFKDEMLHKGYDISVEKVEYPDVYTAVIYFKLNKLNFQITDNGVSKFLIAIAALLAAFGFAVISVSLYKYVSMPPSKRPPFPTGLGIGAIIILIIILLLLFKK